MLRILDDRLERPPLKWSILRYGFEEPDEEGCDAEKEAQS